jgi:hypothetical protein
VDLKYFGSTKLKVYVLVKQSKESYVAKINDNLLKKTYGSIDKWHRYSMSP